MNSLELVPRAATYQPDLGHYNPTDYFCYTLKLDINHNFFNLDFVIRKEDKKTVVTNFIEAFHKKKKAKLGIIWHDFCGSSLFKTINGKIELYIHDGETPTLVLNDDLALRFISYLSTL